MQPEASLNSANRSKASMTDLLQLQRDLVRARTVASVLAVARDTFAHTLTVTSATGRDPDAFHAARVLAAAVAADGRDAIASAPSPPTEPSQAAGAHEPKTAESEAPRPEPSPAIVTGEPGPAEPGALSPDDAACVHVLGEPGPVPASLARDDADEVTSGGLSLLCLVLATRLNAEAGHAPSASDRFACQQAAVYAAEIAGLLPGVGRD